MDNIILGLLLLSSRTIYQLRERIDKGLNMMYSSSMGSIQAAIKKLLNCGYIQYEEAVENGKYKKIYSITDSGKQNFIEWVSTPMEIQSSKNPELAKLYFMGFSTKEKREAGLQEYISKLKEQYDVLNAICKEAENVKVPDEDKDILHYQLTAARYGKDFMKFNIEWYQKLLDEMRVAYYTGLRIGEVCGLTWQDINLEEQYLTVRRSMRYNGARHKTEIGATKRKKIRTVDFCDTLAAILKTAKTEQHKNRFRYGELYSLNYYLEVKEKDRTYYEVYSLPRSEEVPEGYKELSFVCLRPDGAFEAPSTVGIMCRTARKKVEGLEDFHFHMLRHTYTSNLLSNGAAPKDVQELLGHADVSTTMNIYAHATREAKRTSARLLDKVIGGE